MKDYRELARFGHKIEADREGLAKAQARGGPPEGPGGCLIRFCGRPGRDDEGGERRGSEAAVVADIRKGGRIKQRVNPWTSDSLERPRTDC